MARIRGRNTSPEVALRALLWREGLRYRLNLRIGESRPDVVFPRSRVAVFIDGCFWHGCPDHYVRPRSRETFWADKLKANVVRDRAQTIQLEEQGWTILRFWEHEVACRPTHILSEIVQALGSKGKTERKPSSWVVIAVEQLSEDSRLERRFLQDLRDPALQRIEERERTTRKW